MSQDLGTNVHGQGRIQDFPLGGRQPLTQALFGENYVKTKDLVLLGGGAHRKLLYVNPPLMECLVMECKAVAQMR